MQRGTMLTSTLYHRVKGEEPSLSQCRIRGMTYRSSSYGAQSWLWITIIADITHRHIADSSSC